MGFAVPALFFVVIMGCGLLYPNYSQLSQQVSILGAEGTVTQYYFTIGLVLCALLSLIFIWGLMRVCRRNHLNTLPVFLLFSYSFSIAGAGIFPLPNPWHGLLGSPSFLLLLSPPLAWYFWRRQAVLPHLGLFVIVVMVLFTAGFSIFFPDFFGNYLGVKQRFFHLGWMLWFSYLAVAFVSLNKKTTPKVVDSV